VALDTSAKLINMLAFINPLAWAYHFEVDGVIEAEDRIHLLHLFGGLFAISGVRINVARKRRMQFKKRW